MAADEPPAVVEEEGHDHDEADALALADPDDYSLNQRLRGLYQKRQRAYKALEGWPGKAKKAEWRELRRQAGSAAANYAMDCLELADRMDVDLQLADGPHKEKFEELYPGGVPTFAMNGGSRYEDGGPTPAGPVSCRLVINSCDHFLGQVGLAGKLDPGLDEDYL